MTVPAPTMAASISTEEPSELGDLYPQPAIVVPIPMNTASAGGIPSRTPPPAIPGPVSSADSRVEEYAALNFPLKCLAENLTDIEATRMAMASRLRELGEIDGSYDVELKRLQLLYDGLAELEHQAVLDLQRAMRAHPLGPWVKRTDGVGEKQAARLLAAIGNPYWNSLHQRPRRGPAELWAFCGYHVLPAGQRSFDTHREDAGGQPLVVPTDQSASGTPVLTVGGTTNFRATPTDHPVRDDQQGPVGGVAPKRRKGQRANWNGAARTRAYLVAESCMKRSTGTYRPVYDEGRAKYAELPKGHAHNRALRLVAKAVLRDIWIESKAWHEETR